MKNTLLRFPSVHFYVLSAGACFLVFVWEFQRRLAAPKTAAGRREPGQSTNEASFPPDADSKKTRPLALMSGRRPVARPAVKLPRHGGAHPPGTPLGGFGCSCEEREVTVLFADVRGFTAFSEKRTPKEVLALLC